MKKLPPLIADKNGRVELNTALVLKSAISRTLAEFDRSLRPLNLPVNPSPSPPKSKRSPSKTSPALRSISNITTTGLTRIELLDLADFEHSPPTRTALSKLQIKKKNWSPSRDEQTNSHSESALMRSSLLKKGYNEDLLAKSERDSLVEMRADAFKYSEREKEKKWAAMGVTPKRQTSSDNENAINSDLSPDKSVKATEQRIGDLKDQASGIVAALAEIESTTDAIVQQRAALASRRDVLEEVLLQQLTPRGKGKAALAAHRSLQEEASDAHDSLQQLEQRLRALQQKKAR
jgi:hypothetical protein